MQSGYLRDLNVKRVLPTDDRRLECVVTGLRLYNGAQLAVSITLVSPLTERGEPRPQALTENGTAMANA